MSHFRPRTDPRPCWHCVSFAGMLYQGTTAACSQGGVRASPLMGCAFWAREVGADDEPGPPTLDTVLPWRTPKRSPSARPSKR